MARSLRGKTFAFFGEFAYWPTYHAGTPADVARQRGARVVDAVEDARYVVIGERRGAGKREAIRQVERRRARGRRGAPELMDEAAFRELVRTDVAGKWFAFAGGFDCVPAGFDDRLLARMVESAGGIVVPAVTPDVDYLVVGNRRAAGKAAAERRAAELGVDTIGEELFLELVRVESKTALDFPPFVTWLHGAMDRRKVQRALTMLKGESFKLYAELAADHLLGVVRSQTHAHTVYAPWLRPDGRYGCATADLAECMGLQGRPCKHLLVLVIGLTHAGQMAPALARAWLDAAATRAPDRDGTLAARAFLQYAGVQAGELDWRPLETMPEDFYAL